MWKMLVALFALLSSPVFAGSDAATAKRFVDGIYAAIPGDRFDFRKLRYAQPLRSLLDADLATSPGMVPAIDFIPFCGCQDTVDDYRFSSRAKATAAGATVEVTLYNGGRQSFEILLVRSRLGWAVSDIRSGDIPSLVAFLRDNLSPKRATS